MAVVCLEGGDACGKATQGKILAERLHAKLFSFPDYTTASGKAILANLTEKWTVCKPWDEGTKTQILADEEVAKTNALVFQSLMLTNRMERSADLCSARNAGSIVLDRYAASSIVHGSLDGLDPTWIEQSNAQLLVQPDVYVLLDASVQESFKRRPERRDRYERDLDYMEKVRIAYLKLFKEKHEDWLAVNRHMRPGERYIGPAWRIVDAMGTIDEVAARVWSVAVGAGA